MPNQEETLAENLANMESRLKAMLAQGEERTLEAEERAVAPKRKYVKKSARWHDKPIQRKLDYEPEFTTAVAADNKIKRKEGNARRRYAEGIDSKKSNWKWLKGGWGNQFSPIILLPRMFWIPYVIVS